MVNITQLQNRKENLRRLAAQRQLYSDAKKWFYVRLVLNGGATAALTYLSSVFSDIYIALGSIIIIGIDNYIKEYILEKKVNLAANIQEEFDCIVLDIPFNHMKATKRELSTVIHRYSEKYLKKHESFDALKNWYPDMGKTNHPYTKILCMQINCQWSKKLRENYNTVIRIFTGIFFLVLFFIALKNGLTVETFVVSVIFPFLPLLSLGFDLIKENNKGIDYLENTQSLLHEIKGKLENYSSVQFDWDTRNLQDLIFEHRKNTTMVPDFIYRLTRDNYEENARIISKEKLKQIIKIDDED